MKRENGKGRGGGQGKRRRRGQVGKKSKVDGEWEGQNGEGRNGYVNLTLNVWQSPSVSGVLCCLSRLGK